jgi:aspartate--ammonia ligase
MGIRVDPAALRVQLAIRGEKMKAGLPFHQRLLKGRLPLCIGGGIGQSRLCMLFLRAAHVGEVQVGIWPDELRRSSAKHGLQLL